MRACELPLVSIVTPVHNGAAYLAECIESVIKQTYSNWEYIIVDNCSTDGTLEIASKYARTDERIRLYHNDVLLNIIANHNRAFKLISPRSRYCKVISADDWLFPECITRMVELAEAYPSVGVVSSYQLSGGGNKWYVRTDGLPYHQTVVSGREIGRMHLLGMLDVLGNPTSTLYRADLVRGGDYFYPNSTAEADISACFKALQSTDFGFVHQVLSYERLHDEQITKQSQSLNAYLSSKLGDVKVYGPSFLTADEMEMRLKQLMKEYYAFLGESTLTRWDGHFWGYHRRRLREVGYPLNYLRVSLAMFGKVLDLMLNPKATAEKLVRHVVAGLRIRTDVAGGRRATTLAR